MARFKGNASILAGRQAGSACGLSIIVATLLLCLGAGGGLLPALAAVPKSPCDVALDQPAGNPYGYRLRGERCEGVYIQEVSSTTLLVASLTESFEDYDLASGKALLIEWPQVPGHGDVRLRTQGLRRRLFYRMDAVRPSGSTSFTWPAEILTALEISRKDIGIVGSTRLPVGQTERDVYVPLQIGQQRDLSRSGSYRLVLLPGVELTELFISLAALGSDGRQHTSMKDEEALGYGYYPAERPIEVPIADLKTPGIYHLEIGARLRAGGAFTVELWLYHPDSTPSP
jgi:hypothetical protein